MANVESLAQRIVDQIADSVDNPHNVQRFTPSVKMGRRYVAITLDNVEYMITVEVEAIEES